MMKWTAVNFNAMARVKLTSEGFRVYEKHMADLGKGSFPLIPKVDGNGWYQDQLWSIAHIFGPALYNGCRVPFETEIQIYLKTED